MSDRNFDTSNGKPIKAHSKSEFKRLSSLGANVIPPAPSDPAQGRDLTFPDDYANGKPHNVDTRMDEYLKATDPAQGDEQSVSPVISKLDLYQAYLLGCEDECQPEPKTFEQFMEAWNG